jgi:DnaJ-class molecular chaperone
MPRRRPFGSRKLQPRGQATWCPDCKGKGGNESCQKCHGKGYILGMVIK